MTTTTTDGGATSAAGGGATAAASSPPPPPGMALPVQRSGAVCRTVSPPQIPLTRAPLLMEVAIRCTAPNCSCDCFSPCKAQIRTCDGCGHGWVSHALDKLGFRHLYNCHQVELVQPSIAFDVASLMLYGTQAIPVRLKILLDRLFSVLQHEEVLQVLHGFGWTYEDYARGYIIQDPSGLVLDRWLLASREEEPLILQQFLRFGETKAIAQQLLLQENGERAEFPIQPPRTESDIKKFIEKTSRSVSSGPLLKQHSSHIYSHMASPMPSLPLPGNKHSFRHSSVSSAQSVSPTVSSPVNCTSPLSLSPLNKLQNMQPYDFRQDKASPEHPKSESSEKPPGFSYNMGPLVSPTTSVPNISITTSSLSSVVSNANHSSTTYTTASSDRSANDEGVYYSEEEDDITNGAINLTRSTLSSGFMDSVFAAKKVRHLRKSANPMKRRWNPTLLATLSTNPATGKKRVQCHVCYKTFCDKGALKIHFSAVHLREMHKCTVEGCNMMFSSRRSRNRHSANPNPKLHSPNYRRKINPHDGRAANPYPIIPPSGIIDFTNGIVSYSSNHQDCDSSSASEGGQKISIRTTSSPLEHRNDYKSFSDSHDKLLPPDEEGPLPLTKRFRMQSDLVNSCSEEGIDLSMKDERRVVENNIDSMKNAPRVSEAEKISPIRVIKKEPEDREKTTVDTKSEKTEGGKQNSTEPESLVVDKDNLPSSTKGVRKRKSMNPTKCTTASDEDLQYVSTDDSSSDTYIDQDNDENGLLDSKSDLLSSDGSDSMMDLDDVDDNNSDNERERKEHPNKTSNKSSTPPTSLAQITTNTTSSEKKVSEYMTSSERYNGFSASDLERMRQQMSGNQKDNEYISENPLRHLESLSLGAFTTNMMNSNNRTGFINHTTSVSSGVSFHAPGLGLASVTTTTAPHGVDSPAGERLSALISSSGGHPVPPPLTSNCHMNNSDTENSMSDQQMPLPPVYRDASMVGSLEIPVDKENPRRCTACGKIFQNHFGVKTHYQNVHLKLMHKCTVEGCNAAFPSKRSRDRHSANLNLHRKLLSTSSDKSAGGYFDKGSAIYPFHPDAYRADIFSPFYDPNSLPMSFADIYHSRLSAESASTPFIGRPPFAHLPGAIPGFHPAFLPPVTTVANYKNENNIRYHHRNEENSGRNSSVSSISNPSSPGPSLRGSPKVGSPSVKLEEDLVPDSDGRFACTLCEKKFHEAVVLQEHYEKCHTQALLQCSKNGCNKVFLSRQSRNIHSDSLHNKEKAADAT